MEHVFIITNKLDSNLKSPTRSRYTYEHQPIVALPTDTKVQPYRARIVQYLINFNSADTVFAETFGIAGEQLGLPCLYSNVLHLNTAVKVPCGILRRITVTLDAVKQPSPLNFLTPRVVVEIE
jgi:hypothetical protein